MADCSGLIDIGAKGQHLSCCVCKNGEYCPKSVPLHAQHSGDCSIFHLIDELIQIGDAKKLKCCKTTVQKIEGSCNKVKCLVCSKYNCWLCLEFFNSDNDCYDHLSKVHRGLYAENEFDAYAKNLNIKQFKCCGRMVEKYTGCNHVTCKCEKHVCWNCLEFFNSDKECYSHLRQVHKKIHD